MDTFAMDFFPYTKKRPFHLSWRTAHVLRSPKMSWKKLWWRKTKIQQREAQDKRIAWANALSYHFDVLLYRSHFNDSLIFGACSFCQMKERPTFQWILIIGGHFVFLPSLSRSFLIDWPLVLSFSLSLCCHWKEWMQSFMNNKRKK